MTALAARTQARAPDATEAAEVEAALRSFLAALHAGNLAALGAHIAEEATFFFPGAQAATAGRSACGA